ncbi:MAG TPA: DUF481 domain-containing protein [Myxococcales bacterium]|jgi:hypothetical protein|nr:DUF481 domain-containing protein [Myxococcales bacterium]
MISCIISALLAQAPVAAAPGAPAAAEGSTTTGNVAAGAIVLTGNSQTTTFSVGAAFSRKTPDWIYGFKASAAYGRSTDPATGVRSTTALNGSAALRGERRFTPVTSLYLQGIADTDHLKSVEWRPAAEGGVSFYLVDQKEGDFQSAAFRLDLGFRGGREYRFQYYPTVVNLPDETIAAPAAGFAGRYALSRDTIFTDELSALVNVPNGPRLLLTNVAKLTTRLVRTLSFSVSFGIAEDSSPPPGKLDLDTNLTVSFELAI